MFGALIKILNSGGIFKFLSITSRIGFCPFQSRTVRAGLSARTVFVPTRIAISSARCLCATCREKAFEIQTGSFFVLARASGARNPSVVSAHLKCTDVFYSKNAYSSLSKTFQESHKKLHIRMLLSS